ncbi:MAG: DUF2384 domain-containing protein [Bacteroidales bacterium]|nr:DUF2384 domain-containing protein [Bacteroidales bacterium]
MKKYKQTIHEKTITEESSVAYYPKSKTEQVAYKKNKILEEINKHEESYKILDNIFKITNLPNNKLAKYIYEMTPKTLASYKQKRRYFSAKVNEISIKVTALYKKGIDVFITKEKFNSWLGKNSFGLGNVKPINLLSTSTGIDLVYEELVRIEFGDNA